uniref:Uncharacterized protein n=1 Tax=Rhizophora mucronata TaxID=61149 RepID=A0A2P2NJY5_RHIMU
MFLKLPSLFINSLAALYFSVNCILVNLNVSLNEQDTETWNLFVSKDKLRQLCKYKISNTALCIWVFC